jgi:hypothetical protein
VAGADTTAVTPTMTRVGQHGRAVCVNGARIVELT